MPARCRCRSWLITGDLDASIAGVLSDAVGFRPQRTFLAFEKVTSGCVLVARAECDEATVVLAETRDLFPSCFAVAGQSRQAVGDEAIPAGGRVQAAYTCVLATLGGSDAGLDCHGGAGPAGARAHSRAEHADLVRRPGRPFSRNALDLLHTIVLSVVGHG
jgi:hypothetical protein